MTSLMTANRPETHHNNNEDITDVLPYQETYNKAMAANYSTPQLSIQPTPQITRLEVLAETMRDQQAS
jgi:hypothetical protein